MTENQKAKESPEKEKEEIIDLESMINSFTDFSTVPIFEIDERFCYGSNMLNCWNRLMIFLPLPFRIWNKHLNETLQN